MSQSTYAVRINSLDDAFACVVGVHACKSAGVNVPLNIEAGANPAQLVDAQGNVILAGLTHVTRYLFAAAEEKTHVEEMSALNKTFAARFFDLLPSFADREQLPTVLTALNEHLSLHTFLVGNAISAADAVVFATITTNKRWGVLSKNAAAFANVSRWMSAVQNSGSNLYKNAISAAMEDLTNKNKAAKAQKIEQSRTGSFEIDLPGAKMGEVVTRFPPEPSGYLHIGHAKALFLNHYFAKKFQGKMLLRFDDTNPAKEKEEFVENIMADMRTLGLDWVGPTYTSDYFELMATMCVDLIKRGLAYCDNTNVNQMREERLNRIESKCRNNSIEENMRVWNLMWNGEPEGLAYCVRAKMDMSSPNGCMRDATIYRCNDTPHHRTGTKYKCYPTYDFACPIVDSIEGVTHCLRTIEYHDRNEQYSWMCKALNIREPVIWDYSRLNFTYTLLSKRKLQWFVDQGLVEGWFDPRFPTVQGIIRRGLLVESLKEFMLQQGASKNVNLMEWDKLWANNKAKLELTCSRLNAVSSKNMVSFELTDVTDAEIVSQPLVPKNPEAGVKAQVRGRTIYLEHVDANEIKEGEEVTLISWGNAIVERIERGDDGSIKLIGRTNLSGDVKSTSKKLHWVSCQNGYELVPVTLVEYGHLITVPKLEEDQEVKDCVNPNSKRTEEAVAEQALRAYKVGDIVQFQRKGFYRVDAINKAADNSSHYVMIYIPDGRKEKK